MPFDDYLLSLAAAIADGSPVDWAEAEARAESEDHHRRLRQLRALAVLAGVHRSWNESGEAAPTDRPDTPNLTTAQDGRFLIERALGKGGFGVVYKAYDRKRKAQVALKSFNRRDIDSVYDIKTEFRVLADLSHPNLVSLYELFADGDSWFIAMELVNGVDFLAYLRTTTGSDVGAGAGPPAGPRAGVAADLPRLEHALGQLTQALCYLHARHKLHCDIKPSNVLVAADGQLKVLDFGLATDLIPRRMGDTIRIRGTPAYVAPEQAAGSVATAASDWYAVGGMLFEALTGERPFSGSFVEVLEAKRHTDAPAPSTLRDGIPEALDRLCHDLLARDPSKRPTDADMADRLQQIWPSSTAPVKSPPGRTDQMPFIGRAAQLELLNDAFQSSTLDHPEAVFVHGASGMGKSALVREFLDRLRERRPDLVILEGRCYERESVPYKALDSLVDALSRYLRRLPRTEAEALLPRDVSSLTRLFPMLRRVDAVAEARYRPVQTTSPQELRRRGFAAFRELLARLTDRHEVVLVIDDLQWSDTDSAALIADIILSDEPPPLLFIACYRSEEAASSAALGALLATAEHPSRPPDRRVHEVIVDELSAGEARQLADELSRHHKATAPIESIVRESGRSPFFINELIEYSAALTPTPGWLADRPAALDGDASADITLDSVIRARTSYFGEGARRLVQVLAVFGAPLDVRTANEAAGLSLGGLDETTALRAAHLTRTRLLPSGEQLELYHDRIREAVVAGLSRTELQQLHGRLAAVLERSEDVEPETLVAHFHGAGQNEEAARYAVLGADRAREAMAFSRAALGYRFALDFGQFDSARRRAIQVLLGDVLAASGRGYDAAQTYLSAADQGSAAEVLELKRRAAEQLLQSGHIDEGLSVVRDVLRTIGLKLAESPRQALLSLLGQRTRITLRGLGFRERDLTDIPADALVRVDTCWSVATGLAIVDYIRAAEFQARHLLLALRTGEPYRIVRALAMELAYTSIGGVSRQRQNEKLLAVIERLAARVDNPEASALVTLVKGSAAYMQGRWARARELFEDAETVLRERCTGVAWEMDTAHFYTLLSLFYLGEVGELSRRLPALLKEARERDALYVETNLRARVCYIAWLAADDPERAAHDVRQGMERWSQGGFHLQHYYEMVSTTEIALYSGRGAEAWAGVERCWGDLRRSFLLRVQPVLIESLFLRARAALAAAMDPSVTPDRRARLIAAAERDATRLAKEKASWAQGLSSMILSGVRMVAGSPHQAVARLQFAEAEFEKSGMNLYLAVARRRRGELTQGQAGQLLIDEADSWMRRQAIRNGARFVAMLAPVGIPEARPASAGGGSPPAPLAAR